MELTRKGRNPIYKEKGAKKNWTNEFLCEAKGVAVYKSEIGEEVFTWALPERPS